MCLMCFVNHRPGLLPLMRTFYSTVTFSPPPRYAHEYACTPGQFCLDHTTYNMRPQNLASSAHIRSVPRPALLTMNLYYAGHVTSGFETTAQDTEHRRTCIRSGAKRCVTATLAGTDAVQSYHTIRILHCHAISQLHYIIIHSSACAYAEEY